jgi:hypothetical protein
VGATVGKTSQRNGREAGSFMTLNGAAGKR